MRVKRVIFPKDHKQTKSLVEAGNEAAINAVRHAKALDITITYIENGAVYEEQSNGVITFKKNVVKKDNPIVLTKGMVLHAK